MPDEKTREELAQELAMIEALAAHRKESNKLYAKIIYEHAVKWFIVLLASTVLIAMVKLAVDALLRVVAP
jgi:hypothetical protein